MLQATLSEDSRPKPEILPGADQSRASRSRPHKWPGAAPPSMGWFTAPFSCFGLVSPDLRRACGEPRCGGGSSHSINFTDITVYYSCLVVLYLLFIYLFLHL